jgi:N-acetyl-gamma-glutamyl-phosphate reductase
MKEKIKIGIVGGSGFTGMELVKILNRHSYVKINFVTSRKYKGLSVNKVFPSFQDNKDTKLIFIEEPKKSDLQEIELIFTCLPPLKSMEFLNKVSGDYEFKVIDLGSDFRLKDPDEFMYWYETRHIMKEKLSDFVYGIPEINKEKIKKAKYIANPGCYPTSILLGLAPVLKSKLKIMYINIDSKSGVSGAGRKLKDEYLFTSLDNNFYAYSATGHRHTGEIEQEIENIGGKKIKVSFTPHLMAVNRGIFTSIYCGLKEEIKEDKIFGLFENFYKNSPFVMFKGTNIPQLKDVVGTNMCLLGFGLDKRTCTLKIFSVIDNLLKGAAGQAVQNMNIMMDFDEKEGLEFNGIFS